MNKTGLPAWLQRLEALHPTEIELGLDRVRAVAERLQLLPVSVPVVTIAGTNGKGSTAAALEALLLASGRRPGVYTSPHLLEFNERIRVAGQPAGDAAIVGAFERIDGARGSTSLTYFEFATLAGLLLFRDLEADVLVLEVGLGGRLDAVNIVDADVAVITSIALDHQGWLGDTLDAISREKAGILRRGQAAVIAEPAPALGLLAAVAASGARALHIGRDFHCDIDGDRWRARLRDPAGDALELPPLPLGAVVPINLCAALQALLMLGEDPARLELAAVLGSLQPPGRRQQWQVGDLSYLLDVAHNPQAVDKLLEYLNISPCQGKTIALFSVMKDKDIHAMIHPCGGVFDAWFLADQPDNPRAARAQDIAAVLREADQHMISVSKNLRQAMRRAQSIMAGGDRLVVFGSFFTVAAVIPILEKDLDRGRR